MIDIYNIIKLLEKEYPIVRCTLDFVNPLQLLISTQLAAQCTDERVNKTTPQLFERYKTAEDFAKANLTDLEQLIKPTGFFHNKAKNIIECCRQLLMEYQGEVPHTMEELTSLAGVGRKTDNVIRGNVYHEPSIVVDTHVKRISKRLGLTTEEDPEKIEYDLMKVLPKDHWILYNIQIIAFGRDLCEARSPKCELCRLQKYCGEYKHGK